MPDELDKIRDAIAEKLGWYRSDYKGIPMMGDWKNDRTNGVQFNHPVPASLDWVAEQWPKERAMSMDYQEDLGWIARAWNSDSTETTSRYRPTELHARLALLLAVLEAEGKTP